MNQQERAELCTKIAKEWADKGKLIEGGFQAMRVMTIPAEASDMQVRDMRAAFFAGAQHLFGSIMGILGAGTEPIEADLNRMSQISDELDQFIVEYVNKNMPAKGNA